MLVVTSRATQTWLKEKFNHLHLPHPPTALPKVTTVDGWQPSFCTFASAHTTYTRAPVPREEPGEGWSSQGCHTNRPSCYWAWGRAVRGCRGRCRGRCATSLAISPQPASFVTHTISQQALWSAGCPRSVNEQGLSSRCPWAGTWGESLIIRGEDCGEPCHRGTLRPLQLFLMDSCHPDCSSQELTCLWVPDVGETFGRPSWLSLWPRRCSQMLCVFWLLHEPGIRTWNAKKVGGFYCCCFFLT